MAKKKQIAPVTTPEGRALTAIAAVVHLPHEQDYDNLVMSVQHWVARGEAADHENRRRYEADRARLIAEMYLGHARRTLAFIADEANCPTCAELARATLGQTDMHVPRPAPGEEDPTVLPPPAEGEPAELLARLERIGGLLLDDLTAERKAAVYHIKVPHYANHAYSQVNISLAALRYALPQWEALHEEIQARELDPGGWPELPAAALVLWMKQLADARALGGGSLMHSTPFPHLLPLLSVLQKAARELDLSPEEFAAAAQLGRGLEQTLCRHVPPFEGALRARWGTQADRVWPPPAVRDEE